MPNASTIARTVNHRRCLDVGSFIVNKAGKKIHEPIARVITRLSRSRKNIGKGIMASICCQGAKNRNIKTNGITYVTRRLNCRKRSIVFAIKPIISHLPNSRRYRQGRDLADKATRRRIRRWGRDLESAAERPHLSGARGVGLVLQDDFILVFYSSLHESVGGFCLFSR
jgi:hypothetical protein